VRWAVDKKENWERKKEIEADHRKVEKMVPKQFHKWLKVFGKVKCNDKSSRDDNLITLNVMRERRELDGVFLWIVLPTYILFLFVYVYA